MDIQARTGTVLDHASRECAESFARIVKLKPTCGDNVDPWRPKADPIRTVGSRASTRSLNLSFEPLS